MSKLLLPSNSLNYFAFIVSFLFTLAEGWWPQEYPRIGLARWLEMDQEDHNMGGHWRTDFENMTSNYLSILDQGQTFIVSPQITGLGFECNATYPVQWVSFYQSDSDYPSFYTRVRYFRTNPDIYNTRSNTFISSLDLYGDQSAISGNYSCVSVEFPDDVIKSIYVYWQGSNPSNLVLGGKEVEPQSKDGHYLILPCRVSRPDVTVNLYREVNSVGRIFV
ncbi:hypothetical protein Fcan01_19349 [Folsomia candida]|uniref:Uncharacterized protein n=1 Tax=Folsomia candida TaxID=158441 RepID=A0A226DMB5_FOLCA|nr:hypothetical protein Fcan01_19349 [Folsomia candida]